MDNNIIVLTTGLSGSSVITSFISQAGYWLGDQTIKKDDRTGKYDTYENSRLVSLNKELIRSLAFEYDNDVEYQEKAHLFFEKSIHQIESKQDYYSFVEYCNSKGNWIWKDPRLWMTIGFWSQIIDKTKIKIIIAYREPFSLWISLLNKRQIVSYFYLKKIEKNSREEIKRYLNSIGMDYCLICYDELIIRPERVIPRLNEYLNTKLALRDLMNVYHGKVRKKTWSLKRLVKAIMIYLKNYNARRRG